MQAGRDSSHNRMAAERQGQERGHVHGLCRPDDVADTQPAHQGAAGREETSIDMAAVRPMFITKTHTASVRSIRCRRTPSEPFGDIGADGRAASHTESPVSYTYCQRSGQDERQRVHQKRHRSRNPEKPAGRRCPLTPSASTAFQERSG